MELYAKKKVLTARLLLLIFCLLASSCSGNNVPSGGYPSEGSGGGGGSSNHAAVNPDTGKNIDLSAVAAMPPVLLKHQPKALGEQVESSEHGEIDYSRMSDGYVMVRYTGETTDDATDVKVLINSPNTERGRYQYNLPQDRSFYAFPLTEGSGSYVVYIYKRQQGSSFLQLLAVELDVEIENEFMPFLISNQKIVFSSDSLSVKLAAQLTKDEPGVLHKVEAVFNYVIENIQYDVDKAMAAADGLMQSYIPDNDMTLITKTGICFDYATLTVSMLRSLDIPTKLVFGYASTGDGSGPVYHAWISIYSPETGWVDRIIEFISNDWTRMDPTFSAGGSDQSMAAFIGDGSNYIDDFLF